MLENRLAASMKCDGLLSRILSLMKIKREGESKIYEKNYIFVVKINY